MFFIFGVQNCTPSSFIDFCDIVEGITVELMKESEGWNAERNITWFSTTNSAITRHIQNGHIQDGDERYDLVRGDEIVVDCENQSETFQETFRKALKRKYAFDPILSNVQPNSLSFYCPPQHINDLCASGLRVAGTNYACRQTNAIIALPSISTIPVPPSVPVSQLSLSIPPPPYHIEIFHDGENCTCVGDSVSAVDVYNKLIRAVLKAYCGNEEMANRIDISQHVVVNWNFVLSKERQNDYNKPTDRFFRHFIQKGVQSVDAGNKSGGVDNYVKYLMQKYQSSFGDLPEDLKSKRIAVLLSGDSDFSHDLRALRSKGFNVMLAHNIPQVSPALLDEVIERFRLGNWYDITGIVPHTKSSSFPPPDSISTKITGVATGAGAMSLAVPKVSASTPSVSGVSGPVSVDLVFRIAEYILMKNNYITNEGTVILYSTLASTIGADLYPKIPNLKAAIQSAGNLSGFCAASEGALQFITPAGALHGIIVLSFPSLAALLIRSLGGQGRLAASELDTFYSKFGAAKDKVKSLYKENGRKEFLCVTNGPIMWESVADVSNGYGYFVCVDAAHVSGSPAKSVLPRSKQVQLSWAHYNYINQFLKTNIDQLVAPDVDVEIVKPSNTGLPQLVFKCNSNTESAVGNDSASCTTLLQSATDKVKALLDGLAIRPYEEFNASWDDIKRDPSITAFKSINKLYMASKKVDDMRDNNNSFADSSDSVNMTFPQSWWNRSNAMIAGGRGRGRGREGAREGRGRGAAFSSTTASRSRVLVDYICMYMFRTFRINLDPVACQLVGDFPSAQARLTLTSFDQRRSVLSYDSDEVSFTLTKPSKTIERANISIIYPKANEAAMHDLVRQLQGLERDVVVIDNLFNPLSISKIEFFFNEWKNERHWAFIEKQIEALDSAVSVTVEKIGQEQVGQPRRIRLEGRKMKLHVVEEFLRERAKSILYRKFPIPENLRSEEMKDAVKKALESTFKSISKRKQIVTSNSNNDDDDDDSARADGGEFKSSVNSEGKDDDLFSGFSFLGCKCYIRPDLKEFSVTAFPERRALWLAQCNAGIELVESFFTAGVYLEGYRVYSKSLISTFGLLSCKYDSATDSVLLTGLKDRVESAVADIKQKKAGQTPVSEYITFDSFSRADKLMEYLNLRESKDQLGQIRNEIMKAFSGVNAAIAVDGKTDHMNALMLHGARAVLDGPDGALAAARKALESFALTLKMKFYQWPERELKWLMSSDIRSRHSNALIDFKLSNDDGFQNPLLHAKCTIGSCRVSLACCDLRDTSTIFGCDAIVNSANGQLLHGGGIARALADIAGRGFNDECQQLIQSKGSIQVGSAVMTGSHGLADVGLYQVIHAVPPNMQGDHPDAYSRLLFRRCITCALDLATRSSIRSLAIPGMGVGLFGWPMQSGTEEMILAISQWVAENPDLEVEIVLFDHNPDIVGALKDALIKLTDGQLSITMPSTTMNIGDKPKPPTHQWFWKALDWIMPSTTTSVTSPGDKPQPPTHQWFWRVWDWELANPSNAGKFKNIAIDDGTFVNAIPYDYDQVMKLERERASGATSCDIAGDIHGNTNSARYVVSLTDMTQTRIPMTNKHSCRPVYRLPIPSTSDLSNVPLYDQRCAEYENNVKAYNAQSEKSKTPALVLPLDLDTSCRGTTKDDDGNSYDEYVSIYGTAEVIERVVSDISQHIADNTFRRSVQLESLMRRNSGQLVFSNVVIELRDMLRGNDVTIASQNQSDWTIEINSIGQVPLLQAMVDIANFENKKLADLSRIRLPASWGYDDLDEDECPEPELVSLASDDEDYALARDCFHEKDYKGKIVRIERVQNVELYRLYQKKKVDIANRNNGNPNEMLLKHGTSKSDPSLHWQSSPAKKNSYPFDFRYSTERNFYGRGAYFADDAGYSKNYSYTLPTGELQMFLVYVAAGKHDERTDIDRSIVVPKETCQSVRGPITTSQYGIVVYDFTQSYPAYLITYTHE